ncbi:DUF3899 domain-containing protein [Bacillus sp. PS06]|uniref:DUF3899 domain-containing protein n=1 Tax=Bacillus sp. PS06 TaxID=2764176 RepID=UPI00177ED9CF|nr:DUF3899 domain-containing protein [Bacillus sp. PS06]MBD8067528.1 DUF3899 domain-containing protein [Bacillus sp. PS06]
MKNKRLRPIIYTLITIFIILVISMFIYQQLSLLHFINLTFIFSAVFILLSLFIFVTKKGFFDGITISFRKFYKHTTRLNELDNELDEMRLPSEQIPGMTFSTLFITGLLLLIIMFIAIIFY